MDNENLKDLICRIQNRDRDALTQLYSLMKTRVYGLALVYTKSDCDAEDVMQTVFMNVWTKSNTYRGGNPSSWIMTMTRNLAVDHIRANRRWAELSDSIPDEDCFEKITASVTVKNLFSELRDDEREIVLLYSYGFSHSEISVITKRPQATVRWKYSAALKKLRKISGGEGNE